MVVLREKSLYNCDAEDLCTTDSSVLEQSFPAICSAYNASCHEGTRVSPHFLLTRSDFRLPADLTTGKPSFLPSTNAITDLQDRMRLVHEVVKTRSEKRRNLMKKLYDQKASPNTAYSVGHRVMLRNFVFQNNKSYKFHLPYCGLWGVVEVLPPVNYVRESLDGSTTKRVHFNRLKKSCGRINEKSTVEDEKPKELSRNDWPNCDMRFCRVFPQVGCTCHEVTILVVIDQSRPRSRLRRPHHHPDV